MFAMIIEYLMSLIFYSLYLSLFAFLLCPLHDSLCVALAPTASLAKYLLTFAGDKIPITSICIFNNTVVSVKPPQKKV